jgi:Uma2 family endonuclease
MATQVAPLPQIRKHPITLDEYERMIEADVFHDQFRLELIRGELIEMSPPGIEHEFAVAAIANLLGSKVGSAALVWPQGNSIRLPNTNSRPQPDATLLRWRDDYSLSKPPTAEDVILVVEVSDTTLKYDQSEKSALYAEAGIQEYWIINLRNKTIETYSDPVNGAFTRIHKAGHGEEVHIPGGLVGEITIDEVLHKGKPDKK